VSKPTLKTCSKIDSLGVEKIWYNSKNRYWYCLWEGKPKALHRLLAEVFIPNPSKLGDVHHEDGDRNNNCVENLSWVTRSENIWHSYNTHERKPVWQGKFNEDHPNSCPIKSICLKSGKEVFYPSLHEAERSGFLKSKISLCINGKRNKHKGHRWEKV